MPERNATAMDGLEIRTDAKDLGTVMHLAGRVSIDSAPALRDRLLAHLQQEKGSVIVDLSEVSYLDCAGIATLIEGLKVARNHLITFRLEGLKGDFEKLFQVTGLLALFETYGPSPLPPSRAS